MAKFTDAYVHHSALMGKIQWIIFACDYIIIAAGSITPESYEKIWKENFLLLGIHNLV